MIGKKTGRIAFADGSEAAVAEHIRTRGITRCPTACVLPTQGSVAAADQALLREYAAAREQRRSARAMARQHQLPLFSSSELRSSENRLLPLAPEPELPA